MSGARILDPVSKLVDQKIRGIPMTDIVIGTIDTLNPISITIIHGVDSISLPQEIIDIEELPTNVSVGDSFRFLRYNMGKRFLPLNAHTATIKSLTEQIQALQAKITELGG